MTPAIERRLAEIERMLAQVERRPELEPFRDPYTLSDAECVEEWHRLCHMDLPRRPWPALDPDEEAAIRRQIRALLR